MRPGEPYRLRRGDAAPVQRSGTTCGSAALTVARMMADPGFARWILGDPDGPERFAAYEQVVLRRTNALCHRSFQNDAAGTLGVVLTHGDGKGLGIPWPRALGTSPLGAVRELQQVAGGGARYRIEVVRWHRTSALEQVHRSLAEPVRSAMPVLLYVGSVLLPRHVVLLLPGSAPSCPALDVYDPATGQVIELDRQSFAGRRLRLAGWDVPWMVLRPRTAARH